MAVYAQRGPCWKSAVQSMIAASCLKTLCSSAVLPMQLYMLQVVYWWSIAVGTLVNRLSVRRSGKYSRNSPGTSNANAAAAVYHQVQCMH